MQFTTRKPKVVITGVGAVTPLGVGVDALWEGLCAGRSGITTVAAFDASGFPTDFGGEAPAVDPDPYLRGQRRRLRKLVGKKEALGLCAAAEAMEQAGLAAGGLDPARLGVAVGTEAGRPDLSEVGRAYHRFHAAPSSAEAFDSLDPLALLRGSPNLLAGLLAIAYDAQGPSVTISTACTSSGQAIGQAMEALQAGRADVMLAGGADVLVEPFMLTGFSLLGALSTRCDDPARASRPFDRTRDGFVLADGAGFVVLETARHARHRGATPLAELAGHGSSLNAYRITDSPPDGAGALQALEAALRAAAAVPEDVDYINAHGTSTKMNDASEACAVRRLYAGCSMAPPPVSSFKAQLGHLVAACGAVELIGCVRALQEGLIPGTRHVTELDPEVGLDVVPEGLRPAHLELVLTSSFGFGGSNACLALRRVRS